jgi:hypothetical protein
VDVIPTAVRIGGMSKPVLQAALQAAGVQLNPFALALFADERFTTSAVPLQINVRAVTVTDLGFAQGAVRQQLMDAAAWHKLGPCPLELGPHLRLQFSAQSEGAAGHAHTQHCAPPGAITVVSEPMSSDDDVPKGFYLRKIHGVLWLRGYRSWAGHVLNPHDVLLFTCTQDAV